MPPPLWVCRWLSVEEIVIILRVEVILCPGLVAEWLTVGDLLQVVQVAGNPFVAVAAEGVEVDGCPAYTPEYTSERSRIGFLSAFMMPGAVLLLTLTK